MYYDAKEQHTLSDDLVKAFKEAEIPEASLVHFGWMFHGTEMTGEHKERMKNHGEVKGSPGNLGILAFRTKEERRWKVFKFPLCPTTTFRPAVTN